MKVTQLCLTLWDCMDYTVHGITQTRILEWVSFPFSRGSSNPGIEPTSPKLQVDFLPAEPQGKLKNTGVSSLSLQHIFSTQKLNTGLLHCRQFLNQLSHKGSSRILEWVAYPFSSGSSHLAVVTGLEKLSFHSNHKERQCQRMLELPHTCTHLTR